MCEFGAAWRDSGAPLTGLRQLAVSFQVPCLVGIVFQDDIGFRILEIAEANKNDVTLYHGGGTEKGRRPGGEGGFESATREQVDDHLVLTWFTHTFFLILPRIWHRRLVPSKQYASSRPFPSILDTCAYSGIGQK